MVWVLLGNTLIQLAYKPHSSFHMKAWGGAGGGDGVLMLGHSLHISMFPGESIEYIHLSKLMPQVPTILITFFFL